MRVFIFHFSNVQCTQIRAWHFIDLHMSRLPLALIDFCLTTRRSPASLPVTSQSTRHQPVYPSPASLHVTSQPTRNAKKFIKPVRNVPRSLVMHVSYVLIAWQSNCLTLLYESTCWILLTCYISSDLKTRNFLQLRVQKGTSYFYQFWWLKMVEKMIAN